MQITENKTTEMFVGAEMWDRNPILKRFFVFLLNKFCMNQSDY